MPFDPKPARLAASFLAPYLSSAFWNLEFIPVKNAQPPLTGTMGVDKYYRCYYDAAIEWTAEQGAAVLVHEVGHLLRAHHARAEQILDLQALPWLLGTDMALNADLVDDPKLQGKWPFEIITPETFKMERGHTAERYYSDLIDKAMQQCTCPSNKQQQGKKPQQNQGGGQGKGQPQQGQQQQGAGQQQQSGNDQGNQPGDGQGQGDPNCPVHGHHDCGSCAGGDPRPYEKGAPSQQNPGVTEAQGDLIRRQVAEDIKQYESDPSRSRGTVPGGWLRWSEEILQSRVPWQRVLPMMLRRARMTAMARVDYSYQRPHRRSHDVGFILPKLLGPDISLGVVCDTSGSMGSPQIGRLLSEIGGMLKQFRNVTVYSVDAGVHASKRLTGGDVKKIQLIGGGGTDMMLGINHVAEKGHDVVVCLTDTICPFDEKGPGVPVVIAAIDAPDFVSPTWARTIKVSSEGEELVHAA